MEFQQNVDKLTQLKLTGMLEDYRLGHGDPAVEALSFDQRFGRAIDSQVHHTELRRFQNLQRKAKLKQREACVEGIDYTSSRGLNRSLMGSLNACSWADKANNIVITGPTGIGKSYLACALGNQCLRRGLSVLYLRLPRMLEAIKIARADGSLPVLRLSYAKPKVLIVDDFGLSAITHQESADLLEVIEDRYDSGSLIMSSQVPHVDWLNYIDDPTVADAILDRVMHRAHRIELRGESMRKLYNSVREDV